MSKRVPRRVKAWLLSRKMAHRYRRLAMRWSAEDLSRLNAETSYFLRHVRIRWAISEFPVQPPEAER